LETAISKETLQTVAEKISIVPEGFHINPKMVGQLARRSKMGTGEVPMDWGFAEALSFGSLVLDGTRVRLSGQDSGRGTFSHRHALMYDTNNGASWCPLAELRHDKSDAKFEVFDSSLSEQGVLGFEYGYSTQNPNALVMWEAQFGDFANGAQVIIDQYVTASEEKWKQKCRLVMLLPHGYEGQGPEHSSARLKDICSFARKIICRFVIRQRPRNISSASRHANRKSCAPLVVMTPKSLLRLRQQFDN
jgi:2-oxoglutarate dehydrogenase E1 component